jgi:hypothetical protein
LRGFSVELSLTTFETSTAFNKGKSIMQPTTSTISINPIQLQTPTMPPNLDPTNPLIWLLVLATLLTATEKPLNAIANLLRAIAPFLKSRKKDK